MHLRVRQQNSTGMKMAQVLEAHPKVLYFSSRSFLSFCLHISYLLVRKIDKRDKTDL